MSEQKRREIPIGAAIREVAEADPDRPALTHADASRTLTRMELERRTNRLARAYEQLGVRQDDLVTIALPNGIAFFESAIACWKLGATPQPVSAKLPVAELEAIIELADPPIVVGATAPGRTSVPVDFEPDSQLSDEPLLPDRVAASWKAPTSGGSTGRPKIILAGGRGVTQRGTGGAFQVPYDSVVMIPGALYHNAPFMFASMGLFRGSHVIVTTRFDPALTVDLIERHRVEWMWVVPTMMSRIMRLPEGERLARDMSSLKTVWHGAAPCPPWVKEAWIDWFGGDVIWELYAGTAGQGLCVINGTDWKAHRGSVGKPVFGKMKVVSADGDGLPTGEIGEIYMLPPNRETPSYRYIGAEAKVLDGPDEGGAGVARWESIGDMGYIDDEGYVYLADRRTDLILSGGANIYPAEIEAALDEHPNVSSCAVIGLPDEDMGQIVHAIVEPRVDVTGYAEEAFHRLEDELRSFLEDKLVRYKLPRSYEFVSEPLRDDAGKVRRSALRAERLRV